MPAPFFDLILLGYRNDLARERALAFLRTVSPANGGPVDLERETPLPYAVCRGLDHTLGLRLLGELRDRGAQVRLVPSATEADRWPATPSPPPLSPGRSDTSSRLVGLLLLFTLATTAYFHFAPPAPPRLPSAVAEAAVLPLAPGAGAAVPQQLNDEAVELNAAGKFADAAGRLRSALERDPNEPALQRNLKTVLHNWAVVELNAEHTEIAVALLEEGLAIDEDPQLLSALGIARVKRGEWGAAGVTLERAVTLGAADPYTLIGLGRVYRQQGNRAGAVEMFHRARDSGAGGADFQETLARLERELDAEWDFAEMSSPHFHIAFAGGESQSAAQVVLEGLEEAFFHVGRKLDLYPGDRIPVVLYPSEDFHDVTQTPSWTSGIYDGRIKLPVGGLGVEDAAVLQRTLRHEYGHVLVHQLSRGQCPVWLNEGVAIWTEETSDGEREGWARDMLADQELFALRDLEGSFTRLPADRVRVAYAQSYLAVRALVARHGGRRVRELLTRLSEGKSTDAAFQSAFYTDLATFEHDFITELTRG